MKTCFFDAGSHKQPSHKNVSCSLVLCCFFAFLGKTSQTAGIFAYTLEAKHHTSDLKYSVVKEQTHWVSQSGLEMAVFPSA